MALSVQELATKQHHRASFDCGIDALNRYLRNLAAQHRAKGISTTFVVVESDQPTKILGYYSVSAAALLFDQPTDTDRKGLPNYPIPAVRIGRLATAVSLRRRGLGELLLQNAIKRILQSRGTLGVYAVIVEAKDAAAEAFYRKYGFRLCDLESRQLYLPLGAG